MFATLKIARLPRFTVNTMQIYRTYSKEPKNVEKPKTTPKIATSNPKLTPKPATKSAPVECRPDPCAKPKPKRRLFDFFGKRRRRREKALQEQMKELCKQRAEAECDENLSRIAPDRELYRTEGIAKIRYKDKPPVLQPPMSKQEKILKKIEADEDEKNLPEVFMPQFTSVEQRMIELDKRRLHPHYKKYSRKLKKFKNLNTPKYVFRTGPIRMEDIPVQLKYNKELLEKKNMYWEYKRVYPPRCMVSKMIEIEKNVRPTLEKSKKWPEVPKTTETPKSPVDTLYQENVKLDG